MSFFNSLMNSDTSNFIVPMYCLAFNWIFFCYCLPRIIVSICIFTLFYHYLLHINTIYGRQAGGRKILLDVVPLVWNDIASLIKSSNAARSPLLRKYLMKLTQRIGLTCLPHRTPTWQYVVRNHGFIVPFGFLNSISLLIFLPLYYSVYRNIFMLFML